MATNWVKSLVVGDLCDAKDQKGNWYEARVLNITPQSFFRSATVEVRFRGFSTKWNETLPLDHNHVSRLNTRTQEWRSGVTVGDKICMVLVDGQGTPAVVAVTVLFIYPNSRCVTVLDHHDHVSNVSFDSDDLRQWGGGETSSGTNGTANKRLTRVMCAALNAVEGEGCSTRDAFHFMVEHGLECSTSDRHVVLELARKSEGGSVADRIERIRPSGGGSKPQSLQYFRQSQTLREWTLNFVIGVGRDAGACGGVQDTGADEELHTPPALPSAPPAYEDAKAPEENSPPIDESQECVVCMTRPKDSALVPCGHRFCEQCCDTMDDTCPVCRANISLHLRVY